MTNKEKLLVSKLLELAGEEFSNHGCNDCPDEWFSDWTKEELKELDRKVITELNGAEEYEERENFCFNDSSLMSYFSSVFEKEVNRKEGDE